MRWGLRGVQSEALLGTARTKQDPVSRCSPPSGAPGRPQCSFCSGWKRRETVRQTRVACRPGPAATRVRLFLQTRFIKVVCSTV